MTPADLANLKRTPQRISATVPFTVYERLAVASNRQGRSISNLCAFLIERGLDTLLTSEGDLS